MQLWVPGQSSEKTATTNLHGKKLRTFKDLKKKQKNVHLKDCGNHVCTKNYTSV